MKYDVCVFGGCTIDKIFYQKRNGKYNERPNLIVPGGKGSNQAVAASRAGAKTTIITKVKNDRLGKNIVDNLRKNEIDISNIEMINNIENGYSNIYIKNDDKDNEIKRFNGTVDFFSKDMIENHRDAILNSNIIVCQLKVPKEVTEELINFCYENKKFLILTPCKPERLSIDDKKNVELINKISLITCNEKECQIMFKSQNVEKIVKKYPNKLIVTLGKRGLMYYDGNKIIKLPAIRTEVVDTVGAGDTLCGNLAYYLSQNESLPNSIQKAMYAATMKLGVKTAQAGMPNKTQLEEFILNTNIEDFKYKEELKYAINIIHHGYDIIKNIKNLSATEKKDKTFVTNADVNVEEFLISQIKNRFQNDNFLTEEFNPNKSIKDRTWIIDPIDGTHQFMKNMPYWGIQMAFYDNEKTRFAIIYLPILNEFYFAAEGKGVFLNYNKIQDTKQLPLKQCIVEFGGSLYKEIESKTKLFHKLVKSDGILVSNLIYINACCMSFTNLVSKKTDALIIASNKPWDVMPGIFMLEELDFKRIYLDESKKLSLFTKNEEIIELLK